LSCPTIKRSSLSFTPPPEENSFGRLIKRLFDVVFSGVFLLAVFWWITVIVAIITEITMPGPVFFRQKRTGYLGKEFYIFKYRTMVVNDSADFIQATASDPRITRWGAIMRRTHIDELPQFINVFLGDMSIVGPRPHMLAHTEKYSALIDNYMARHSVLPGLTGWAQINGALGETRDLKKMEDRVLLDLWYIENWSLALDAKIILRTGWR